MGAAGHTATDPLSYTFVFKRVGGVALSLDLYPPILPIASNTGSVTKPDMQAFETDVAALIYFHGGGLTVGNRDSWLGAWVCRCNRA